MTAAVEELSAGLFWTVYLTLVFAAVGVGWVLVTGWRAVQEQRRDRFAALGRCVEGRHHFYEDKELG